MKESNVIGCSVLFPFDPISSPMLKPKWASPIANPIIKDQFKSITILSNSLVIVC